MMATRVRWRWSIERSNSSAATGPALIRAVANATSPSPRSLWAPLPRVWSRVKAACVVVNCPARAAASMSSGNAQVASHRLYQGRPQRTVCPRCLRCCVRNRSGGGRPGKGRQGHPERARRTCCCKKHPTADRASLLGCRPDDERSGAVGVPGGVALDAANRDQESRSRWRLNLAQPNAAPD